MNREHLIFPIRKTGKWNVCRLTNITYDELVNIIGFEPNVTDLDDSDKVKASWGFVYKGEECGVWCYKYYGDPKNCHNWSFFGPKEIAEELFDLTTLE